MNSVVILTLYAMTAYGFGPREPEVYPSQEACKSAGDAYVRQIGPDTQFRCEFGTMGKH